MEGVFPSSGTFDRHLSWEPVGVEQAYPMHKEWVSQMANTLVTQDEKLYSINLPGHECERMGWLMMNVTHGDRAPRQPLHTGIDPAKAFNI